MLGSIRCCIFKAVCNKDLKRLIPGALCHYPDIHRG